MPEALRPLDEFEVWLKGVAPDTFLTGICRQGPAESNNLAVEVLLLVYGVACRGYPGAPRVLMQGGRN